MSVLTTECSVSVVIPTRNRPQMVRAAVRSALAQRLPPFEVIVVIDGPENGEAGTKADAAANPTQAALAEVTDSRLRVLALPNTVGGGEARNVGVRTATGKWIAFLDDDDLWLPGKLAAQLGFAAQLPAATVPVLSCPVLARGPHWEEVWPRQPYRTGQPMAEYLFCRQGWRYGAALLQTSTLFAPRELLLRTPFTTGLRKHQDWDWLLRVAAEPGVSVYSVGDAPLAVFHVEGDRRSVGRASDWRFSLNWALKRRACFTRRAFAGFLATECAAQAQSQGWRAQAGLLAAFLRFIASDGLPSMRELLRLGAFLLAPQTARRALRNAFRPGFLHPAQRRCLYKILVSSACDAPATTRTGIRDAAGQTSPGRALRGAGEAVHRAGGPPGHAPCGGDPTPGP